ncbi:Imm49 family immunity protein [Streptomyces sp. NPDC059096]|uniref:Imm49 family immunity protein n=1 Tax=Streptomyces sp. NPDC059096 TaxID=3346727 RepID=UPI0036BEBF04
MRCLGQRHAGRFGPLEATGPQQYVTPGTWPAAFHLAVVCRKRDRITNLCRVPLSRLQDKSAHFNAFGYTWTGALPDIHPVMAIGPPDGLSTPHRHR